MGYTEKELKTCETYDSTYLCILLTLSLSLDSVIGVRGNICSRAAAAAFLKEGRVLPLALLSLLSTV
jgi:hypothetical protein